MFLLSSFFFFFNDTATTEIYTLSLHDALPISPGRCGRARLPARRKRLGQVDDAEDDPGDRARSEEHTSELQSQSNLVCRLLLEKKKKKNNDDVYSTLYTLYCWRLYVGCLL